MERHAHAQKQAAQQMSAPTGRRRPKNRLSRARGIEAEAAEGGGEAQREDPGADAHPGWETNGIAVGMLSTSSVTVVTSRPNLKMANVRIEMFKIAKTASTDSLPYCESEFDAEQGHQTIPAGNDGARRKSADSGGRGGSRRCSGRGPARDCNRGRNGQIDVRTVRHRTILSAPGLVRHFETRAL